MTFNLRPSIEIVIGRISSDSLTSIVSIFNSQKLCFTWFDLPHPSCVPFGWPISRRCEHGWRCSVFNVGRCSLRPNTSHITTYLFLLLLPLRHQQGASWPKNIIGIYIGSEGVWILVDNGIVLPSLSVFLFIFCLRSYLIGEKRGGSNCQSWGHVTWIKIYRYIATKGPGSVVSISSAVTLS